MKKSMGEIIRSLRKERNLTQEDLAEILNVSGQAISKWENGISMPDISQIVPIASVFGISTDVLFDVTAESENEMVNAIIDKATQLSYNQNQTVNKSGLYEGYIKARDGLKIYPNNMVLLMYCLEKGVCLAYSENDTYDEIHAEEIYKECIREANIVISYGKSSCDVLRAHMIMVILHSAYGNYDAAFDHSQNFPWRADMTVHKMLSFINHAKQEYTSELANWQNDSYFHLEALIYDIATIGLTFLKIGKHEDAIQCFESYLSLIKNIFKNEAFLPPLHRGEFGNIYLLLAKSYLSVNKNESAIDSLKMAVDYELNFSSKSIHQIKTPIFNTVDKNAIYRNFRSYKGNIETLIDEMKCIEFAKLNDDERYVTLINTLASKL